MTRALSLVLALVLVISAAGSPLAVQPASTDPGGMVTISESQIDSDLPPNTPMSEVETDLQERGILTSAHSDTLEIIVTNPGRAKKYTDGAVFGGGPVAIVMRDNVNSEGRRVAIPIETLKDVLGYVPKSAYGTHEEGSTWQDSIQVQDGYAIVDVPHFSDNTVTFAGEINITESRAGDGSQISYQINDLDSASDPQITLIGKTSTENETSESTVTDGDTMEVSPAGNTAPTGQTTSDPKVIIKGTRSETSKSESLGTYSSDTTQTATLDGNKQPLGPGGSGDPRIYVNAPYLDSASQSGTKQIDQGSTWTVSGVPSTVGKVIVDYDTSATTNDYSHPIGVYFDGTKQCEFTMVGGRSYGTGVCHAENMNPPSTTDVTFQAEDGFTLSTDWLGTNVELEEDAPDVSVTANGQTSNFGELYTDQTVTRDLSAGDNSVSLSVSKSPGVSYGVDYTAVAETEDPSVSVNGATVSHAGVLSEGSTSNGTVPLDVESNNLSVSTVPGSDVTVQVEYTERTQTADPSLEINGNSVTHSGTLSDGKSVLKAGNSSWLVKDENTINVSVGDGSLSADAPAPTVGLEYTHDTQDDQTVTYDSQKWSERYNVSKTYASSRSQATLTIPHQGTVIEMRSIEYRINESSWTSMPSSYYTPDGTELAVDVEEIAGGSVEANEKVEVRTTASKVAVNSGSITVTDPTVSGSSLDSEIEINSWSDSSYIAVGGTPDGQRIHYSYNESYSDADGYGIVTSSGENRLHLPNAGVGSTMRISTIPVAVNPKTGDARVSVSDPKNTEPEFQVKRGSGTSGDEVEFTFVSAQDSTEYILYSKTEGIQRDSGTANSPITLTDDDSDELLVFLVDDTNTSSTAGEEDGPLPGQFQKEGGGIDWKGLLTIGVPVVGLLGAVVVYRRRDSGPTDSSGGVASRATGAVASIGGTLVTAVSELSNRPRVVAVISILGALAALLTGVIQLPPGTGIVPIVAGIPLATYLIMQRFDSFNPLVFATVSGAGVLLGLELLGGFVQPFLSALGPGVLILAIGVLVLAYQGIQSYRAAESAPDEKNVIQIRGDD